MNVTEMQHSCCIVKLEVVSPLFLITLLFRLYSPDANATSFLLLIGLRLEFQLLSKGMLKSARTRQTKKQQLYCIIFMNIKMNPKRDMHKKYFEGITACLQQ